MKNKNTARMSAYSVFSTAFILTAGKADAQIIYHDIDPDTLIYSDELKLDMNGDDVIDFKILFTFDTMAGYLPDETRVRINPLNSNKAAYNFQTIAVTYSGLPWSTYTGGATQLIFNVAPVFDDGAVIDTALNFETIPANLYQKVFYYVYSSYAYEAFYPGDWMGAEDKFLGVQFVLDGASHFGWIRLSLSPEGAIVKDFAYEAQADVAVTTHLVQYTTEWISVEDAGVTGTAADLQFSFTAASDEADFLSYRVAIVKLGLVDAYTDPDALMPDQYVEIIPDGSASYSGTFAAGTRDVDGDPIITGQTYKLVIANMMQPATGFANILSKASPVVKLVDTVGVVPTLNLVDLDNTGTGNDVKISFDAPDEQQGISEFRIFMVKSDSAADFTIEDALVIPPENYITQMPDGIDFDIYLNETSTDVDGDLIGLNKYKCFILSVPDGVTANVPSLSLASNAITLEMATSIVPSILLQDVGEYADGRDLKISITKAPVERTIDEYRIYIMDISDAFDFNVTTALTVPTANYFTHIPDDNDFVINGDESTTDIHGAPISWGVPYYVFVLSKAGIYGSKDSIALPSAQLILNFPTTTGMENTIENEIVIFSDGTRIFIQMHSPNDELASFELFDLSGKLALSGSLEKGENILEPNLPAGIYTIVVRSNHADRNRNVLIR